MSDYTKEDLQKAREWLAEHDGFCLRTDDGQGAHTAAQALAAFRAEARREARKDWTAAMDDARHSGYQQGVQEEAERCQSEREACERIVDEAIDDIGLKREVLSRFRERDK